ncbi:MAG: hypothetical protein J6R83_04950, partial [Clostridia bacterium]|nr:hypothetical protein [Clostridia bacterium]
VYRYADYEALKLDAPNYADIYTHYSTKYWDFTNGYPVFKSIIRVQNAEAIAQATKFYLGGSETATTADLLNNGESIDAYAIYNGKTYYPTLTVVSGESVTVAGDTITAKALTAGSSVVSAYYNVEGAKLTVQYTINVSYPEFTEATIKYSTLDNQVFLPFALEGKEIVSIVDSTDNTIYYENGSATANVPQNVDSKTLTDYTKDVIVAFSDNTGYKTTLTSYTLVIDEEEDLANLVKEGGTSSSFALVTGYYIVNNDITHGTWAGNKTSYSAFVGTFDGDGHTVEFAVGSVGLFNALGGKSLVKNTAFVVNHSSTGRYVFTASAPSYNTPGYTNSSDHITLTDVYVDVNVPTTSAKVTTLFGGQYQYYVDTNNFIYDFADGVRAWETSSYAYNGTFGGYINNAHFTQTTNKDINNDGVMDYAYTRSNHKNTYYISAEYPYIFSHYTKGTLTSIAVAENDIATFNQAITDFGSQTSVIGWVKGIYHYADYQAMANAGLDISSFDNGLWDICTLFGDGPFMPLDEYVNVMVRIAGILKTYGKKVIFATTTP